MELVDLYKFLNSIYLYIVQILMVLKEFQFNLFKCIHFYIYDNESSDDLYKKLSSYISQGIVTYTYWPTKGVYSTRLEAQLAAYNDSLYKYKYDTKKPNIANVTI